MDGFEEDSLSEILWCKSASGKRSEIKTKEHLRWKLQRYLWKVLVPIRYLSFHPPTKEILNCVFERAIDNGSWIVCRRCTYSYHPLEHRPHRHGDAVGMQDLLYSVATSNCLPCYLGLAMVSCLLENKKVSKDAEIKILPHPELYESELVFVNKWVVLIDDRGTTHTTRAGVEMYSVPSISLKFPASYSSNYGQCVKTKRLMPRQRSHIAESCTTKTALERLISIVENCTSMHASCRSAGAPFLPSRVLDLLNPRRPTLVEGRGLQALHITLSYCWGKADFIQTRQSTLSERELGIKWDVLLQTFQEAIMLTVKLGVRYHWIDALCIIQDSDEDWEYESGRMCSVYTNSYLTIAATCASSPIEGFLKKRCRSKHIARINVDGSEKDIYIRNAPYHLNGNHSDVEPMAEPLLTRGWAYQRTSAPQKSPPSYFARNNLQMRRKHQL